MASSARIIEQQNDVRLQDLHSKVSALRNITIDIHDSAADQSMIDQSVSQDTASRSVLTQ